MTNRTTYRGPLACAVLLAGAMAAAGHGGATGIVGERMMGMMMLSEQMKLLAPIADQPTPSDMQQLTSAAEMIRMHAGPAMTDLFPEGSLDKPSEARPQIWERWQEFVAHASRLGELGAELDVSARQLAVPTVSPKESEPAAIAPQLSEWESMDYEWLMGLSPIRALDTDPVMTGAIGEPQPETPPVRPVRAIYADISATCAACHAAFRQ